MAKQETNVSNLKINRGTYANIQSNLSQIGENELIIVTDKAVPIPTTSDSGKVIGVNASGNYELVTGGGGGGSYTAGIGISIASNTISNTGVAYVTTAPSSANTSGDLRFVVLDSEPSTRYDGYIYIITEPAIINFTISVAGGSSTAYQAEEGMTWAEWCDSEYNTGGYAVSGNSIRSANGYIGDVVPTDVIVSGQTYYAYVSGGSN